VDPWPDEIETRLPAYKGDGYPIREIY